MADKQVVLHEPTGADVTTIQIQYVARQLARVTATANGRSTPAGDTVAWSATVQGAAVPGQFRTELEALLDPAASVIAGQNGF